MFLMVKHWRWREGVWGKQTPEPLCFLDDRKAVEDKIKQVGPKWHELYEFWECSKLPTVVTKVPVTSYTDSAKVEFPS